MDLFALRPATHTDYELMWRIQRTAMRPSVDATWGWVEDEQRRYFDRAFHYERYRIIQVRGQDAGFLSYEDRGDHVYLTNVALLPRFQNRGVGGAVVAHVIDEAEALGLPVKLQVLEPNHGARRLYERLGFRRTGETETHVQMTREVGGG